MADIISELASKSGISADLAKKGMGTLLSSLKDVIPADSFSKVLGAVPGANDMMAAAQTAPESSGGGILGAVTGMAGKLFGGGAGAAAGMVSHFTRIGFSAEQLQKFLPNVLELLKNKLPADLIKQITGLIPIGK